MTVADAAAAFRAAQERFGAAGSVLVVGGGPAGVELSAEIKLAHPGTSVTLVSAGGRLLDGDHNHRLGERALERLRAIGVSVRLGVTVAPADGSDGRYVMSSGEVVAADAVVWATGTTPNTGWLRGLKGWLDETEHVTVSGVLADLDRAGYVERQPDPGDRRRTIVRITPANAPLIAQWLDGAASPIARVLDKLNPDEQEAFLKAMSLLESELRRGDACTSRQCRSEVSQ